MKKQNIIFSKIAKPKAANCKGVVAFAFPFCGKSQRPIDRYALGGSVKFVNAVHYIKGEGIEKKEENFAAEVAAQIAGAK